MELKYVKFKDDHLAHHGVKGMKWGVRRAIRKEKKMRKRVTKAMDAMDYQMKQTKSLTDEAKKNTTFVNLSKLDRSRGRSHLSINNAIYTVGRYKDTTMSDLKLVKKYKKRIDTVKKDFIAIKKNRDSLVEKYDATSKGGTTYNQRRMALAYAMSSAMNGLPISVYDTKYRDAFKFKDNEAAKRKAMENKKRY